MISLLDKNGNEIKNQDQIINRIEEFYSEPYDSKIELEDLDLLNSQDQEPDITDWDVRAALRKMKYGKTAGRDNISIELMKCGEGTTPNELAKLFSACLKQQQTPTSWKEEIMFILLKKEDKRDIKIISLFVLYQTYKLLTKIIALRIEQN